MLKPTKMTRVVIAGTKDLMEPVISTFHKLNILHITDFSEEMKPSKSESPLNRLQKCPSIFLSLRAISNQLGIRKRIPDNFENPGNCNPGWMKKYQLFKKRFHQGLMK